MDLLSTMQSNRMLRHSMILACVFAIACGCAKQSQLEQTSHQLEPALTKAQVQALFSRFDVIQTGHDTDISIPTKTFSTNHAIGSYIVYSRGQGRNPQGYFENCKVWFDTNDMIMAYRYQIMN